MITSRTKTRRDSQDSCDSLVGVRYGNGGGRLRRGGEPGRQVIPTPFGLESIMSVPGSSFVPALIASEPFTELERYALAGFLAGYSGMTFEAYALDLRQYVSFCATYRLGLFEARRAHIEAFARHLEAGGHTAASADLQRVVPTCPARFG